MHTFDLTKIPTLCELVQIRQILEGSQMPPRRSYQNIWSLCPQRTQSYRGESDASQVKYVQSMRGQGPLTCWTPLSRRQTRFSTHKTVCEISGVTTNRTLCEKSQTRTIRLVRVSRKFHKLWNILECSMRGTTGAS